MREKSDVAAEEPPGLGKGGKDDGVIDSIDVELDNNMEVLLLESLSGSTGSAGAPTACVFYRS